MFRSTSMSLRATCALVALALSSLAPADELAVPVGQQGADKSSLERPTRGMATAKVEAKFGAPLSRSTAVGSPPISHWDYPGYQVYFEGDKVLHTVLKPVPTEAETGVPTPAAEAAVPAAETAPAPAAVPEPLPAEAPAPEALAPEVTAEAQPAATLMEETVPTPAP